MLHVNAFVPVDKVDVVCEVLTSAAGVSHVMAGSHTTDGLVNVSADIRVEHADSITDLLAEFDLATTDLALWRVPEIRPLSWSDGVRSVERDTEIWSEVVNRAHDNARVALAYVIYMIAAGVIAGVGVLTGSSILVVGAMAISPDLLPISASAIGFAERRWRLAVRSCRALAIGLGIGALASFAATALLRVGGRIPEGLVLAETVLGPSLTQLGPGSLLVAAAAGVAGMLSFERAGGVAVGVAISVTTIPAAAYVGAATALGRTEPMWGALLVLVTNIVVIVAASATTLVVQRRRHLRR